MRLLDILGDKREFAKLNKFLGINNGRIFLSTAAQGCLVIRCKDWMMLSEDLEVVCGQHILSEGGSVSSGVLAAEDGGFSHGKYLPCGEGEWHDMKVNGDRQMIERDIDALTSRMSAECDNVISVTERYQRGEYTTTGTAAIDIRAANKKSISMGADEYIIMEDPSGKYFISISHNTLKGLHMLGAEVFSKIMPQYGTPFTYFIMNNLRTIGAIEGKNLDHGPRVTQDGRPISNGACKVCWVSVDKAMEMLERESSCFARMRVEPHGNASAYLDDLILHKKNGSVPMLLALSALRWHGLTDEGIVNILSDAEDDYLRSEYRGGDYEAQKVMAMYKNTRNAQSARWRADRITSQVEEIMGRISAKYPGTVVDYPATVREMQAMFGLGEYSTELPF